MPASSSSYACCLRRAAAEGVVTEMSPAPPPLDAWAVPAMPSGLAGALIRDGGRRLPAHDPLLGGAPSAGRRSEAPQPIWRNRPSHNNNVPATGSRPIFFFFFFFFFFFVYGRVGSPRPATIMSTASALPGPLMATIGAGNLVALFQGKVDPV